MREAYSPYLRAWLELQLLSRKLNRRHTPGGRCWLKYYVPATHLGDLDRAPSSWFGSTSTLAILSIWGVNQQMRGLFDSAFQVK